MLTLTLCFQLLTATLNIILHTLYASLRGGHRGFGFDIRVQSGANGMAILNGINVQAQLILFAKYHYFVLDEVDELKQDAMAILKSTMNYPRTIWVLTTNNFSDIEAGVKDRCHCIPFIQCSSTSKLASTS
jgi:DNA polymerase III delta prime subunit